MFQLEPDIQKLEYEKQYALNEANEYNEYHKTEKALDHDLSKYSLKQVCLTTVY